MNRDKVTEEELQMDLNDHLHRIAIAMEKEDVERDALLYRIAKGLETIASELRLLRCPPPTTSEAPQDADEPREATDPAPYRPHVHAFENADGLVVSAHSGLGLPTPDKCPVCSAVERYRRCRP